MFKPIWRWLTYIPKLPKEWRSEFLQEIAEINYKRIRIFAWFQILSQPPLLAGLPNISLPPHAEFIQALLHVSCFLISLLFLLLAKQAFPFSNILVWIYACILTSLVHGLSINTWQNTGVANVYAAVMFLYAGFLYLPNRISLIFYALNFTFFILSTLAFPVNVPFVTGSVNYGFLAHSLGGFITVFALLITRILLERLKEIFVIRKNIEKINKTIQLEKEKSERLLLNILPAEIALRLKEEQESIADGFAEVTVLFADIVGFTELSARISAHDLVERLNQIFSAFDALTERHQLEKIKTIGDAYMVVGGLPQPRPDHAQAIANMAIDMCYAIDKFYTDTGEPFRLRIGISTGPVVAGVIGTKKYTYDLWGDTVNIASRMESHGMPGRIQLCAETSKILQLDYEIEERGIIQLKGKGEMRTHWLIGKRKSIT